MCSVYSDYIWIEAREWKWEWETIGEWKSVQYQGTPLAGDLCLYLEYGGDKVSILIYYYCYLFLFLLLSSPKPTFF